MVTATPAAARPRRVSPVVAPVERHIGTLSEIPLELIDVGPNIRVDAGELADLAQSIRELGVLQPIRAIGPNAEGRYRAVWGQRRILASRLAEQATIPALVEPSADVDAEGPRRSIEQLVENEQRTNLGAIDEAVALQRVLDADRTLTQADLAKRLGKSPSWLANMLGLLDSPREIQDAIAGGQLTASHAKAMKGLAPSTQIELGTAAVSRGQSAHDLEAEVQRHKRQEEARQASEQQSRIQAAAQRAARMRRIEGLGKKVPKAAPIRVVGYAYQRTQVAAVVQLFKVAGYSDVEEESPGAIAPKPKGVACDCTAWKVEITDTLAVSPGCTNRAHQAAKRDADDEARHLKRAAMDTTRERLAAILPGLVVARPLDRLPARIALWVALGYRAGQWSEANGGASSNPWKTIAGLDDIALTRELGDALAKGFEDRYGYHVAWDALGAELDAAGYTGTCPFPGCLSHEDHPGVHVVPPDTTPGRPLLDVLGDEGES